MIFRVTALLSAFGGVAYVCQGLFATHPPGPMGHRYAITFYVNSGVIYLIWAVGLWLCGNLFMYYSLGDLFSARIVSCIRQIGWVGILKAVIGGISKFLLLSSIPSPPSETLAKGVPLSLLTTLFDLLPGVALLCVAWVMEEGRKIKEEQELTV